MRRVVKEVLKDTVLYPVLNGDMAQQEVNLPQIASGTLSSDDGDGYCWPYFNPSFFRRRAKALAACPAYESSSSSDEIGRDLAES